MLSAAVECQVPAGQNEDAEALWDGLYLAEQATTRYGVAHQIGGYTIDMLDCALPDNAGFVYWEGAQCYWPRTRLAQSHAPSTMTVGCLKA